MIPTAAEVEKHWAVEIFAPLQRWDLMESFTKLPAVPCTAVHGVAKSRTRLSDFTFSFHFHALEKEMATH